MPSPLDISNIPAPRVEFIDPRTGLMAREWYRFFFNLFNLTGSGTNDTSLTDLQVGPPPVNDLLGELGITYDQAQLASMMAQYEQATREIQNQFDTAPAAPQLGTLSAINEDNVRLIGFSTNPSPAVPDPAPVGTLYWSNDDATLEFSLEGGSTGQICQQLDFHPKNTGATQINKGMAVMATGVVGASTKITCARAVADGSVLAQYMLGIAAQNIPVNNFGYVVWFGSVRGFNTTGASKTVPETWVDGDVLYFDPVYPGELTKVEPSAPDLDLPIAIVTNAAVNGAIFVRMKTGESMNELHDVNTSTVTNNDLLQYDSAGPYWKNVAPSAISIGTATNLAGGAAGSLPYQTAASTTTFLGIGAANYVLTSTGTAPTWTLNTGTGSVVRATSPTLVTPTLGAASATSVAFGIGAAATPSITFTGDLNTGVWSPAADTLAASTAGLERLRVTSAGDTFLNTTGYTIGTAAGTVIPRLGAVGPIISIRASAGGGEARYHLYNVGSTAEWLMGQKSGTAHNFVLSKMASGVELDHVVVQPAGHVGISTTPSAWVASVRAIQIGVGGSVSTWDGSNGSVTLGANLYDSGGAVIRYINSAAAGAFDIVAGAFTWRTAPAGIAGAPITLTQAMTLTSAGRLGIGLSAPATRLHVFGGTDTTFSPNVFNTRLTGDSSATSGNSGSGISFQGYTTGTATISDLAFISGIKENTTDGNYAGALVLGTRTNGSGGGNFERMRILSSGNVGIGTTTPASKLEVSLGAEGEYLRVGGDNASNGRSLRFTSSTNAGSNGALHTINAASASGVIAFATGGTERMRVTNTGTVGIGTTTNLSTLTVNGSFASKSPSTVNAATYTVAATDGSLRFTTTNCTVTLPAPASFPGRILYLNTITANSVTSASANVIPLGSNTAGTAILAATAAKFAMLQSDGTNWITMMAN